MNRTNGRSLTQIKYDIKHYVDHDHPYSALDKKKKYYKTHPYQTYSRSCYEHRSNFSSNHKSNENRAPNIITSAKNKKSHKQFVAVGSSDKQQPSHHVAAKYGPTKYKPEENRLSDLEADEHISVDSHISAIHIKDGPSSAKFPNEDDIAKCRLMKVYPVIEPKLKNLLLYIFNDKQDSETLELYLVKGGMESKWQKDFSEEQIKNIKQSLNFDGFDSTLIFRCIEVLRDINPILMGNESFKNHIDNTMKKLKSPRNLLCHNRQNLTASQCEELANSLKQTLGDLIEIIHVWDREMNITNEKMKIRKEVETIMSGDLNENEFSYMCLLKVINCIAESVLGKVTRLICHDKQETENFKEYFKRKGMNSKTYKDTFYKEEKDILESNSKYVHPDLTLYCKIIEACKRWHPSLQDNEDVKKELTNILKQIRGIRNHAIHNMLSLSSKECNDKAQELGESLKNLVDLVNFIQNKKSYMGIDAARVKIDQIKSDIKSIMSCTLL